MLAIIPLIPVTYAAGAVIIGGVIGWFRGRHKKKKEIKGIEEDIKKLKEELFSKSRIEQRHQEHVDDLNRVIVNEETGQTAEEIEFGIFPNKKNKDNLSDDEENSDIGEEDDYKGDDRFGLMDL